MKEHLEEAQIHYKESTDARTKEQPNFQVGNKV